MRKSLLLLSCAVGGAMLFAGGLSPVTAQEKTASALTPQGSWSVNRIEGNKNTTDSYCALSRQFTKGMVLTLGRNAAEEYSLAIDFQSAKLNVDKPVSLTLQPGPGQLRAYEMMPASQRAVVIRLGYDESFFKALKESKALKAEIDGQHYEFTIPDIAVGQSNLEGCMQGLKGADTTQVASGFSAEKIDDAPPMKEKAAAPKVETPKDEPKIVKAVPEEIVPEKEELKPIKATEVPKVDPTTNPKEIEIAKVDPKPEPVELLKPVVESKKVVKAVPELEMEPVPAPKVTEDLVMPPAEKLVSVQEPMEKAPPPPPLKMAETKENLEKPTQAVSIETSEPEVSKRVSPKIEITKVETRKVEKPKAKPMPVTKIEKVETPEIEVSKVEPQKIEPIKVEPKKVEPKQVSSEKIIPEKVEPKAIVSKLSEETKLPDIRTAMSSESKRPAVSKQIDEKPSMWSSRAQRRKRDELDRLKAENDRLNDALKIQIKKPIPAPKPSVAAVTTPKPKPMPAPVSKVDPVDEKTKQDLEKLRSENEQLRLAVKAMSNKKVEAPKENAVIAESISPPPAPTVDPEVMKQLSNLKAENQRLSAALQGQENKLASFDSKSPEAEKELDVIKKQLAELRAENKKLAMERMQARGQIDTAVVSAGNQAMSRIKETQKKLAAAQADNLALSREIEELRQMKEDRVLSSVVGDWDLEKATKRYNEAEREIKRLGMLLEQQRVAHRQEKGELEEMLFDPAVTDMEQRRRLTEMELQLAEAERQLQASGRRMPQRPRLGGDASTERVAVNGMTPDPFVDQQRENLEMQRLNNQVQRQNRQLQAYKRQQGEQVVAAPQPRVQAQPLPSQQQTRLRPPAAPVPAPASSGSAFDRGNLQQLLKSAGVPLSGAVARQSSGQYRWSAGRLVGHAEIVPANGSLDQFAQRYIAKAKQSCGGDFASLPGTSSAGRIKNYEIACIGSTRSTSSSVVFAQKGGDFVAIAHEAATSDLDAAMDARDRVASSM